LLSRVLHQFDAEQSEVAMEQGISVPVLHARISTSPYLGLVDKRIVVLRNPVARDSKYYDPFMRQAISRFHRAVTSMRAHEDRVPAGEREGQEVGTTGNEDVKSELPTYLEPVAELVEEKRKVTNPRSVNVQLDVVPIPDKGELGAGDYLNIMRAVGHKPGIGKNEIEGSTLPGWKESASRLPIRHIASSLGAVAGPLMARVSDPREWDTPGVVTPQEWERAVNHRRVTKTVSPDLVWVWAVFVCRRLYQGSCAFATLYEAIHQLFPSKCFTTSELLWTIQGLVQAGFVKSTNEVMPVFSLQMF